MYQNSSKEGLDSAGKSLYDMCIVREIEKSPLTSVEMTGNMIVQVCMVLYTYS